MFPAHILRIDAQAPTPGRYRIHFNDACQFSLFSAYFILTNKQVGDFWSRPTLEPNLTPNAASHKPRPPIPAIMVRSFTGEDTDLLLLQTT
ncbi:hypothetical protein D3C77_448210 [compost metagenome]